MNTNKTIVVVLIVVAVAMVAFGVYQKSSSNSVGGDRAGLANPASVFCTANGGTLALLDEAAGQVGMCSFPTGEKCEEWALFRGECNVAGVSNTGEYAQGTTTVKVVYRIKSDTAILNAPIFGYSYVELKRAVSGSGARYLSDDEKIEFWEHQQVGTLTVEGKEIFAGAVRDSLSGVQVREKAITDYLLTQKQFSWTTQASSTRVCSIENLDPTNELFPVYVWVYCGEYKMSNGTLQLLSGTSMPVKINYPNELSYYDMARFSYEAPRDGSNNGPDIKKIFPEAIQKALSSLDKTGIANQNKAEALKIITDAR